MPSPDAPPPPRGGSGDAPAWIELTLRLPAPDAELAADALSALAPGGASLDLPFRNVRPERFGLELTGGVAAVRACFPAPLPRTRRRAIRRRLAMLPLAAPLPRIRWAEVREADWAEEWKRHFVPLRAGRLLVRPPWDETASESGGPAIAIDPGRAFGTGQHATTRLCLEAIDRLVRPGDAVLDVGAGSGILAIAAVRLGASRALALDTDPEAVAAARANAARNGLAARVEAREGSLGAAWPSGEARGGPRAAFDLVAANISSSAVAALLPDVAAALRPGGRLIASGFLREAAPHVEAAARAAGLVSVRASHDGEWAAIEALAPAAPGHGTA